VIGLIDAANRFDEDRGIKFETFAERRVRGAMIDALRKDAWPRGVRRQRRELEAAREELRRELGCEPSLADLAAKVGSDEKRLSRTIVRINTIESTSPLASADHSDDSTLPPALLPSEPERPDNLHRLQMGVFPQGAEIIPNPYNKIPGFSVREVHFVPGFPVMAHPMVQWLLDTRYRSLHGSHRRVERSVIVTGSMEAALTPLMEQVEAQFPGVKVFSLPSVDHPQWGRHIELGVKGDAEVTRAAFVALKAGLGALGATLGPELVR